jgi:hypothetical protein
MPNPSPGNLRSPRKRALELGTDPSGFEDPAAEYDPTPGGAYESSVDTTPDPGPPGSNTSSPFKLGQ